MRAVFIAMLMALGIALAGTTSSSAAPAAGGPLVNAANEISDLDSIHCRRYWHRNRVHFRYSRFGWSRWHRCGRWR